MTDTQFRMLMNLAMVSDPWPLSDEEDKVLTAMLNEQAALRGFSSWYIAYHEFTI